MANTMPRSGHVQTELLTPTGFGITSSLPVGTCGCRQPTLTLQPTLALAAFIGTNGTTLDSLDDAPSRSIEGITPMPVRQLATVQGRPRTTGLGRHRRNCSVCAHPKCADIEADFVSWLSPGNIAQEYGLADRAS